MIGKYNIEIYNNKVHYFLTIKRNITVLQGDSGTGKTELLRLVGEYDANGASSGITLLCGAKCTVLTPVDWELRLSALEKHIVFIDETASFLRSKRFAEMVRGSDNYFVIVSRESLSQLPYSVEEIYGLRNSTDNQKYKVYRRIYNEMYRLYNFPIAEQYHPDVVITEDSNSGYEFFSLLYHDRCLSANGKSNIYESVRRIKDEKILVIVDGAAFGAEIGKLYSFLETNHLQCVVYAPESFEYLILCSGLFDVSKSKLEETYEFADSAMYMSWEEYYTSFLTEVTNKTVFQYGKSKLNEAYKTEGAISAIASVMPKEIIEKYNN